MMPFAALYLSRNWDTRQFSCKIWRQCAWWKSSPVAIRDLGCENVTSVFWDMWWELLMAVCLIALGGATKILLVSVAAITDNTLPTQHCCHYTVSAITGSFGHIPGQMINSQDEKYAQHPAINNIALLCSAHFQPNFHISWSGTCLQSRGKNMSRLSLTIHA